MENRHRTHIHHFGQMCGRFYRKKKYQMSIRTDVDISCRESTCTTFFFSTEEVNAFYYYY